jgi:hypothetical protein
MLFFVSASAQKKSSAQMLHENRMQNQRNEVNRIHNEKQAKNRQRTTSSYSGNSTPSASQNAGALKIRKASKDAKASIKQRKTYKKTIKSLRKDARKVIRKQDKKYKKRRK